MFVVEMCQNAQGCEYHCDCKNLKKKKPVVVLGFSRSFGTGIEDCDSAAVAERMTEVART